MYQVPQLSGYIHFLHVIASSQRKHQKKHVRVFPLKTVALMSTQTLSNFVRAQQHIQSPPYPSIWLPRTIFLTTVGLEGNSMRNEESKKETRRKDTCLSTIHLFKLDWIEALTGCLP